MTENENRQVKDEKERSLEQEVSEGKALVERASKKAEKKLEKKAEDRLRSLRER